MAIKCTGAYRRRQNVIPAKAGIFYYIVSPHPFKKM